MPTRAEFLVEQDDGNFVQAALMYDGYPSYVVPILLTKYNSVGTAQKLAMVGDFESMANPEGSKLTGDGRGPQMFMKMPRRKAVFAEFCYVYVNEKWHILLEHECLMPLSMPAKV